MKRLLILGILFLSGCAYNETFIIADGGSTVNCTCTVDKPVSVDTLRNPAIQANAPFQGGKMNDPMQVVTPK